MKIIIVGGGIAGCAVYLALQKHLPKPQGSEKHEIVIYEPYDMDINVTADQRSEEATYSSTLLVGGGLGVAPNGLRVLRRLDEELLKDVVRGGYVTATFNMKSKDSWSLFSMSSSSTDGSTQNPRNLHMVATSRHAFWRALCARIPPQDITKRRISRVFANPNGRNLVEFADGSPSVEADLVIGADGVRSTVRKALFPDDEEDLYQPHYE